jgi:hypothetical protein
MYFAALTQTAVNDANDRRGWRWKIDYMGLWQRPYRHTRWPQGHKNHTAWNSRIKVVFDSITIYVVVVSLHIRGLSVMARAGRYTLRRNHYTGMGRVWDPVEDLSQTQPIPGPRAGYTCPLILGWFGHMLHKLPLLASALHFYVPTMYGISTRRLP